MHRGNGGSGGLDDVLGQSRIGGGWGGVGWVIEQYNNVVTR